MTHGTDRDTPTEGAADGHDTVLPDGSLPAAAAVGAQPGGDVPAATAEGDRDGLDAGMTASAAPDGETSDREAPDGNATDGDATDGDVTADEASAPAAHATAVADGEVHDDPSARDEAGADVTPDGTVPARQTASDGAPTGDAASGGAAASGEDAHVTSTAEVASATAHGTSAPAVAAPAGAHEDAPAASPAGGSAPEVGAPAVPADSGSDAPADSAADGTAPAEAAAPAAPAAAVPTTSPAAPAVGRPRPSAPPPAEPTAAWPSWDDVAVTAPAAAAGATTTQTGAAADDTADVPSATPGASGAPAASAAPAAPTAAPTAAADTTAPAAPAGEAAPLPPLSLGGLSALAFTALNAASVGVPAHALPQSPTPARAPQEGGDASEQPGEATSPGAAPDAAPAEPVTEPAAEPVADVPGTSGQPAAPAAEDTTVLPSRTAAAAPAAPAADETAVVPAPAAPAPPAPAPPAPAPPAEAGAEATAVLPSPASSPADEDLETRAAPVVAAPAAWPTTADGTAGTPVPPGGPVEPTPDAEREPSPLDEFEADESRTRWPRVVAIVGGALALVAVLYVGASYALGDRVPRGATVAGVAIGSMSSGEAEEALTDELAARTTSVVPVVAQDVQAELDPVAAGLVLDVDATVARLTGVDLGQPVRLWRHVAGVGEQPPVTTVDEDALEAALTQLSGSLTLPAVDGTVVFADGDAHATQAVDGWELDTAGAADVLADGWLTALRPVTLPTSVVAPAVSQEETDRALAELAQPLASAPVTVRVGDRQAVLDVATLTANATVAPVDGVLGLQLDGEALVEAVLGQVPDLLTTASDARFEFQDGAPVIVPGTPGTTLDPATVATAVAQAATAGTDRLAAVELVESDPAETTAALEALGVKEVVSEFSTPLTSEPRRTANIANGLKNITGTLVRPGETFSLTEALGPVDAAHGFVEAGAIVNGEHKDAWGGGLSQVSTTTFNAAYFAGFEDVEHTPHSEWFQRYPEGREATIFTGVLDMKWKNTSPYGALVQGFVSDGRAWVRIWGTKHFTVETEKSGRSGVVAPTTVYSQSPTCEPQSAGNPGFSVTNTRRVLLDGQVVDTDTTTWRYKPQNKIVCGSAPAPTP